MKKINDLVSKVERPIRVMQYGEGNFLRGFILDIIDRANEKGVYNGNVAVIKPIGFGNLDFFKAQDNLYTLSLRGKQNGTIVDENRVITSIGQTIDAYNEYEVYAKLAALDTLEVVVSNTTEAGITYDAKDAFELTPPGTYPGKLTKFLYDRFTHFKGDPAKGLIILPVELIEHNGTKLKECIIKYIELWHLGEDFKAWVLSHNTFCNTLVDRIVTGYPRETADKMFETLGYRDDLLDVGEPFGLWVIESEKDIRDKFPMDQTGMDVVFTDNLKPYRDRKVRILNGAHTGTVLAAYLAGQDIVRDCMADTLIRSYMENLLGEIIPTVALPRDEVIAFKDAVIERFENPFIDHSVLAISLNSVSKWKARIMPSFKDSIEQIGKLPQYMTFSFAALMAFYSSSDLQGEALVGKRGEESYKIMDDKNILEFFAQNYSSEDVKTFVNKFASNEAFWGENLAEYEGFVSTVSHYLENIYKNGMRNALLSLSEEA
ncbi:tagaturonate reductase [Cellulosilyticum sp. I15G10I2]|uniref:tagaturonate reductase n=1 Tax=Cellulosilyticum sp. I15G10I2 TaxID=1892843 RepID=UPI00085CC060|nr:tagaturonate reductase [Cellulosilyticum sp. I15G10I2]